MEELDLLKEKWIKRKTLLFESIDLNKLETIKKEESKDSQKNLLKEYLESLTLSVPIKEKGKTGESNRLIISKNYSYKIEESTDIIIVVKNRNMEFEINGNKLYKVVNTRYNASQIISRLMTGDLYRCLMILETTDINKYGNFLEYSKRITI